MGLATMDYGAKIPPDMAFLYFFCAVVIVFVLLGLLFLIARSNARDKDSYCTEGHC
jgi:hypothetical protein